MSKGHGSLIPQLEEYFFQGFEWKDAIKIEKVEQLDRLLYTKEEMIDIPQFKQKKKGLKRLRHRIKRLFITSPSLKK